MISAQQEFGVHSAVPPMPMLSVCLPPMYPLSWMGGEPLLWERHAPPKLSAPENLNKTRRSRTAFSPRQLAVLEKNFLNSHYPDIATRDRLSIDLCLPEGKVQVWYKNRRARQRKKLKNMPLSDSSELTLTDNDEAKKSEDSSASNQIITWNPCISGVCPNFFPLNQIQVPMNCLNAKFCQQPLSGRSAAVPHLPQLSVSENFNSLSKNVAVNEKPSIPYWRRLNAKRCRAETFVKAALLD